MKNFIYFLSVLVIACSKNEIQPTFAQQFANGLVIEAVDYPDHPVEVCNSEKSRLYIQRACILLYRTFSGGTGFSNIVSRLWYN